MIADETSGPMKADVLPICSYIREHNIQMRGRNEVYHRKQCEKQKPGIQRMLSRKI